MTPRKDNNRDERGVAIMYVAVFLVSSLWLVSLAVDMGKLMTTKTELQRAADAAALAGASAIDKEGGGGLITAQASARAAAAAAANTALQERSESVTIDPNSDIDFPEAHTIHVQVHRDAASGNAMTTIFARTLGITSLDVKADAKAKAIPLTAVCKNLIPFSAVGTPGDFSTGCGSEYTLHTQPGASNGGNFQLLDFPDCTDGVCAGAPNGGAAEVKWYIENGFCCCVDIGSTFVDTAPGGKVGPVRQGLQFRFTQDRDLREGICYRDYTGNGSRVLPVPLVSTFAGLNGKTNATITGFAAFFMKYKPTGGANTMQVIGQFIDYVEPGTGSSTPPPANALYTIRLIE